MKKAAIFSAVVLVLVSFAFFYTTDSIAGTATITNILPSGTGVARTSLTFSWDPYGAGIGITYNVKVDDNSNFSSPEIQRTGLSSTSFSQNSSMGDLDPLAAQTQYFILVEAVQNGSVVDQGTGQFTTGN